LFCFSVLSLDLSVNFGHLTDSGQVVISAVMQSAYACQHQQSWGSCTQPRR